MREIDMWRLLAEAQARETRVRARLHRLMQFEAVKGIADWLDSPEGQRIHPEGCECGAPCKKAESAPLEAA
jgi:hypothetical protein